MPCTLPLAGSRRLSGSKDHGAGCQDAGLQALRPWVVHLSEALLLLCGWREWVWANLETSRGDAWGRGEVRTSPRGSRRLCPTSQSFVPVDSSPEMPTEHLSTTLTVLVPPGHPYLEAEGTTGALEVRSTDRRTPLSSPALAAHPPTSPCWWPLQSQVGGHGHKLYPQVCVGLRLLS